MTSFCTLLTALTLALAAAPPAAAAPQHLRILLVTGVDHPAHLWKETAPSIRDLLEKDQRMEVRIVEDPAFLASEAIFDYDVVFLHFKNYDPIPRETQVRENLKDFVNRGKGLVLCHFACGAFPDWPEFESLAGRVWDQKNTHDPRGPFTVNIAEIDHPIARAMKDFQADDELYFCLKGERPVTVLATARSKTTGKDHPMAFAFEYGKGRVFHTPLGHDPRSLEMSGVAELLRRGTLWTGRIEPKLAFRPAQQAGFYDFDTGLLRGKMRWDGKNQGICELTHIESGVQIVQPGLSLMCPYRIFSDGARYGDAARDWPTQSKVRDDGALEVVWPAAEGHPLTIAAVYRWRAADTLDLDLTVTPERDMPRFEVFLGSYFPREFGALVYAKPNMFSEGAAVLLPADVNPLVDGTYLMFPRDREAELMILDGRWAIPPNPVQWSLTRMMAGPLAARKHEASGVTALVMSRPEDCFAVSMPYNKTPPDGIAAHGSLYLSLFGRDVKTGESQTVHSRLVVKKAPTDKETIEFYEQYRTNGKRER